MNKNDKIIEQKSESKSPSIDNDEKLWLIKYNIANMNWYNFEDDKSKLINKNS